MILNALDGKPLPIYGDGGQRARLAVRRRTTARRSARVLADGRPGETYNVGGNHERTNLQIVDTLCRTLDRLSTPSGRPEPTLTQKDLRRRPPRP